MHVFYLTVRLGAVLFFQLKEGDLLRFYKVGKVKVGDKQAQFIVVAKREGVGSVERGVLRILDRRRHTNCSYL